MKNTLTFALVFSVLALGLSLSTFAQDNTTRTPVSVVAEGNRLQDGLNGPVRRVRVETAKVIPKEGNWVEGPREVIGITTYDSAGKKIDDVAYPVEGSTLSGKEHYLHDDKGNVVEMILRSSEGSILSKEAYKYEFDQLGNWTKMSSSVAVYENGKIIFEPTQITYRAISYYYSQAIEKLNSPSMKPQGKSAASNSTLPPVSSGSPSGSPRPSTPSAGPGSATIQPASDPANARAIREPVSAPASVAADKSSTNAATPSATTSETRTTPVEAPAKSVVQHVAEDVLRNAAIELPKPEYSDAALLARASGRVTVQILVDENGNVTNAQATSGHPLLGAAAEAAARRARFSLTKATGSATRVYGVISYDFVPPTPVSETALATGPTIDRNPPIPVDRKPEVAPIPERAAVVESEPKASENYEAARPFYDKGVTFQASGRFAEAAEAFNQALKLNPNDADSYAGLGMAFSAMLKHKDAIPVYKMARQIDRSALSAPAYYMWGHSYLALEKTSDALKAFKQALQIIKAQSIDPDRNETQAYPSLEQLHYGMGIAYLNLKRFSDSIDELRQVVALNRKNAAAYYALAIAYLSNGNRREAENQQRTLRPLDSDLAQKLGSALAIGGPAPGCRTIACR